MSVVNAYGNCGTDTLPSGIEQCTLSDFGDLRGIILTKPNTKITLADLTETKFKELVASGDLIHYKGLFNFDQTTPENETTTSSSGLIMAIRDAKVQGTLTYSAPICLSKSLQDKKGKKWDIMFVFDKGILTALSLDKASVKGFLASYFDVGTLRFKAGTDIQSVAIMYQLESADEYNKQMTFITNEKLGFNVANLDGAFGVELSANLTAGTSIVIKATSVCNGDVVYSNLDEASMWLVNGVAPTAVSYAPATQSYTLTVGTLTAGSNVNIVVSGTDDLDNIYRGSFNGTVGA